MLRCTPESNTGIGGDVDEDHTQIAGGIQSNYWGIYPPRVSAPLVVGWQAVPVILKGVRRGAHYMYTDIL